MKRFLQVLSLGAAALLFAAATPGIAAADHGGRQSGGYQKPYKPYMKPYKGYKNYGHYRRDKHRGRGYYDRPYREDRSYRRHGHRRYGHDHGRHRHEYGGRRHHRHGHRHGPRHDYRYSTFFGFYLAPRIAYPAPGAVAPPAYPVQPQPAYVQPAVVEAPPRDAEAPSTCLMTREYQTEIVVGGEVVPAYGEACLQPDGSWYRGPAIPERY
jgi:hypothetical protein